MRIDQEVTKIDRAAKQVAIHNLATGETYTETYDKLILSPGAHPVIPDLPGIHSSRIHTLRAVEDTLPLPILSSTSKQVIKTNHFAQPS